MSEDERNLCLTCPLHDIVVTDNLIPRVASLEEKMSKKADKDDLKPLQEEQRYQRRLQTTTLITTVVTLLSIIGSFIISHLL